MTATTPQIRPATADDVLILVQLNDTVQGLHIEFDPVRYKPLEQDRADRITWFMEHINSPLSQIFIAEVAGKAVGYVLCVQVIKPESPFTTASHILEIDQLSVEPDWRRRGIASALMQQAEQFAVERGITRLTLTVAAFNTEAVAFYEAVGYQPATVRLARTIAPQET